MSSEHSKSSPVTARLLKTACQQLEDFRRAGVTHLPQVELLKMPTTGVAEQFTSEKLPPVAEPPAEEKPNEIQPVSSSPETTKDVVENWEPSMEDLQPVLSLEEKQEQLAQVDCAVKGCEKCGNLASTRTQTVFGVGDPNARILFIGEAPGADEDRQGEPFVGRAGQLLTKIIEACQLKREDVYICNILKCRPPGNRNPTQDEADNCRAFLDQQIQIVNPEYIVCWGSVAAKNLLDSKLPIGRMRGKFLEYDGAKVLCTYHPSYLLRNPPAKKDVWEDMKFLFRDMGIELSS